MEGNAALEVAERSDEFRPDLRSWRLAPPDPVRGFQVLLDHGERVGERPGPPVPALIRSAPSRRRNRASTSLRTTEHTGFAYAGELPAGFGECSAWSDPVRGYPVNRGVIRLLFSTRVT